ncbi:MAG: hypothetical protein R3F20_18865 [Planctomycetota bacterium]
MSLVASPARFVVALVLLLALAASGRAQGGVLTQVSNATTISPTIGVVCEDTAGGSGTYANSFWRSFDLVGDHGFPSGVAIDIHRVSFSVRLADPGTAASIPMRVRIWEDLSPPANWGAVNAPINPGGLLLKTDTLVTLPFLQNSIVTVDLTDLTGESTVATIVPLSSRRLVVEVAAPNLLPTLGHFYPGGNALGQTRFAYLSSSVCGINTPTTYPQLGFSNECLNITASWVPAGTFVLRHGTQEGIRMGTAVGLVTPANPIGTGPSSVMKQASAGDQLVVGLSPLGNDFLGLPAALAAQLFPTGAVPVSPDSNFPEIHLDFGAASSPLLLYDGTQQLLFGGLGPQGITLSYTVPAGLSGQSVLLQWVVLDPFLQGPGFQNGFFASSEAHVIQML